MVGDEDIIRLDHAVEMFTLLPHGRLAVLPGTDHFAPVSRVEWVTAMLIDFFTAPMPEAEAGAR